ncbi:unknown protein [Seminavis robusta]|uniref:Uncharacterized protein n=1 Tax=Seminavis robusta TaxID=568900 RepID=A0A9N8DI70_9STRA|nr:unknown protein [Seminavis robusta]|eukprot:Sro134_g063500.1 n/a (620) ;mRNA; f:59625-61484
MSDKDSDDESASVDIGQHLKESDERNKRKREEAEAHESDDSSSSSSVAKKPAAVVVPVLVPVLRPVTVAVAAPAAPVAAALPRPRLSLQQIQHRHQLQIQEMHAQLARAVPQPPLPYYEDEFGQDMYMRQLKAEQLRERPPRPRIVRDGSPLPIGSPLPTLGAPSPMVHSRSASSVERSTSPAERKAAREVQRKHKEDQKLAKKLAKRAEEARLAKVVATMIAGYQHADHKHKIVIGQEKSPKDGEIYGVAVSFTMRKGQPTEEVLDLTKFNSKDIRAFSLKCGVKGGGGMTLFGCRMEIARSVQMGTMYNDQSISNPGSSSVTKRINTLFKVLNICFHANNFNDFVALNDSKQRKDYEQEPLSENGVTGNPVKDFWVLVSNEMNETADDSFDTVLGLQEGEDDRLIEWNEEHGFNLNDINRGHDFKSVRQLVCDLMKARERCHFEMKRSGEGSNDLWTYCTTPKFTKPRQSTAALPAVAVYYCNHLCLIHPAIDGKFAAFMSNDLKSDSTIEFAGSADSAGSKAGKMAVSAVVESLATATTDLKEAMSQRNNVSEAISQTNSWNDYFDIGDRYCKLKADIRNGDSSKARMVAAMEVRIEQLEAHLNIVPAKSIIETED